MGMYVRYATEKYLLLCKEEYILVIDFLYQDFIRLPDMLINLV